MGIWVNDCSISKIKKIQFLQAQSIYIYIYIGDWEDSVETGYVKRLESGNFSAVLTQQIYFQRKSHQKFSILNPSYSSPHV